VNNDLRVDDADDVDLAIGQLVLEDRTLLEAYGDLKAVGEDVRLWLMELQAFLLDHSLEVHIDFDALNLVVGLALRFELPRFLHSEPPRITVQLDLVDFVGRRDLAGGADRMTAWKLDHAVGITAHAGRLGLRLDAVILLQSVSALGSGAVSGQALVLELVEDGLCAHLIDLGLLLGVL
jgi:hypothetical protein